MHKFGVILPAAGQSSRFHDKNYKKPFIPLAGQAVWLHSAERFNNRADVAQVLIVVSASDREAFDQKFGANLAILGIEVCTGGKERADSIQAALKLIRNEIDYVAVHDAARPCLTDKCIDAVFAATIKTGAAILATPVSGTLKRVAADKTITETTSRQAIWEAQTPQVFRKDLLREAYQKREAYNATDDAELVERLGKPVHVVLGSTLNRKITTREDLKLAELILKSFPAPKPKGTTNLLDDLPR